MRNIRCVIEYDGTEFFGFQRQQERRTVQGVLEEALASLTGRATHVTGAGRTDAGVHALGQVVNFRTDSRIPVERWPYALNSRLPRDVVVKRADVVPEDFHARKSALAKTYRYTIWNAEFPSVFHDRYAWHVRTRLDVAAMREAARLLVGRRDFAAFRAAGSTPVRSTVRHLQALEVERAGPRIDIVATADGFLYHMMRNIVGTLVMVGDGRRPPEWVADVLASGRRELAGPTAPARGLCLVLVEYG
ncbi:MAG: tRNA pseudouridine(38-40) synthase TruA [Limnochordales bacterium]